MYRGEREGEGAGFGGFQANFCSGNVLKGPFNVTNCSYFFVKFELKGKTVTP